MSPGPHSPPEGMPLAEGCGRDRDGDRPAGDPDPARSARERLDAAVSGLEELEKLRRRQEALVRAALEPEPRGETLLQLRRQLSCLRRKDASLLGQLQELDQQINDLRLDSEVSHDPLETDSRPSSGFFDLSDGASGSLSNSSHSVFSECFCSAADADRHFPSTEELANCLDGDVLVGGLCDDSFSSGAVWGSFSASHPPPADAASSVVSSDLQCKHPCSLLSRSGFPNPLSALVVQSPAFLKTFCGSPGRGEAGVEALTPQPSVLAPVGSHSSSWSTSSSSYSPKSLSLKHMDTYIYSLLQRRTLPFRTSRPRTNISVEHSKTTMWQPSPSVRQVFGPSKGSAVRPTWPGEGMLAEEVAIPSIQKQCFTKSNFEEQDFPGDIEVMETGLNTGFSKSESSSPGGSGTYSRSCGTQNSNPATNRDINTNTHSLMSRRSKAAVPHSVPVAVPLKDFKEPGRRAHIPYTQDQPCYPTDPELLHKLLPEVKTRSGSSKNSPKSLQTSSIEKDKKSLVDPSSLESSSQNLKGRRRRERGWMVNGRFYPTKQHSVKLHKGSSKNMKSTKMKGTSELNEPPLEKMDTSHKKFRSLEDGSTAPIKVPRRGTSSKRDLTSLPEDQVQDKPAVSKLSSVQACTSKHHNHGNRHHRHHQNHNHGHDQVVVVAKPKHKRNDYRWLHVTMEIPPDKALKRVQRHQKKELMRSSAADLKPSPRGQQGSPYACVAGSDSEYSAECVSLFHSTIVDTSEDEKSNYTTNCFGDCESSEEYVEESTSTSDTQESMGGGAGGLGRRRGQSRAAGTRNMEQEMTRGQTKTSIKVKASYNLKKKILRSRSGSLKLMTTV
ncbi:dapper homolog 1 isoform X2 [Cololabis saira]|uniref:dapper homolog 1 isoform X2 n=1 Tax=Cololabis saira TaxID=129043 RepID=UPI002AD3CEDF|nr:dapper homolog 1 isoform X2 [Cololabis saira]